MKAHSPLLILALWLTALIISSIILYSCQKQDVLPKHGNCTHHNQDSTTTSADTIAPN